jgi:hypothetical protein
MLPATYQFPAAIVILMGGLVACFFGYRLFRVVLAIFGFILGALFASSLFGVSDTWPMIAAAAAGGIIGALILFFAYFVGVALVGAGLGAAVANMLFSRGDADPNVFIVIGLSVLGAALAMYLQRYCLIVGTAFGGAWTTIVGAMALWGDRSALTEALTRDVWVAYPLDPAPGQSWVPFVWIALGLIGAGVQLGWTGGERGRVHRRRPRPKAAKA